jgi:hypothetical protein
MASACHDLNKRTAACISLIRLWDPFSRLVDRIYVQGSTAHHNRVMPYLTRIHQLQDPAFMQDRQIRHKWFGIYRGYLDCRFLRAEEVVDAEIYLVHYRLIGAAESLLAKLAHNSRD